MHVDVLITLEAIGPSDHGRVGGKAFNCARLRRAGFSVPDGLVVTADFADDELGGVAAHGWFDAWPPEQRFAVRSSGVGEDAEGQSFAGIHETLLNVERSGIVAAVRACLASTRTEQARVYRVSHGLPQEADAAVLIQPMVDAAVSGVAFTVHPVTGADELVIDAAPGLGDALVSGRIEPDHYRIRKTDSSVLERTVVAGRTPLGDATLRQLAALLLRIEQHFGAPQDVEWAIDGHALWLLQSRPITTAFTPTGVDRSSNRAPDHGASAKGPRSDVIWTRANLREVMPEQSSPQVLDTYEWLLNTTQRKFVGGLLAPEEELGPPFKVFGGRMYFNLSQLCRVGQFAGAPPAAVMRSLGHSEAIQSRDEVVTRPPLSAILRAIPHLLRVVWLDVRAPRLVRWLDAVNAASMTELSANPEALDDLAIGRLLSAWRATGPDRMVVVLVHGGVMALEERLRRVCRRVGEDYDRFVYAQLAAGTPSVTTQQAFDLVEVADVGRQDPAAVAYFARRSDGEPDFQDYREALKGSRFLDAFDRFLDRYGHRGLYESDWSLPRYREDPTPLLFAIHTHLMNPAAEPYAAIATRHTREAAEAWASFDAKLSTWQRVTVKPRIRALLRRLKQRYVAREHCRSELIKAVYHARQLHLALATRFVARDWIEQSSDYFLLLGSEIEAVLDGTADPKQLATIVAARRRQRALERNLTMPLLMRQSQVSRVLAGAAVSYETVDHLPDADGRLTGLCVSRGIVEADVVVIHDPREFARMRHGAILVAPATDPSWTPLFTLAAGVIVEVGGVLSHASTVAREYGLPALANVKQATRRLRTGDRVILDASRGVVTRCKGAEMKSEV